MIKNSSGKIENLISEGLHGDRKLSLKTMLREGAYSGHKGQSIASMLPCIVSLFSQNRTHVSQILVRTVPHAAKHRKGDILAFARADTREPTVKQVRKTVPN